jgi:WD40 repeat protein
MWLVAFSPDGRIMATNGGPQEGVRLWDVGTGNRFKCSIAADLSWLNELVFSPDGRTLAVHGTGGEGSHPRLYDVDTGQLRQHLQVDAGKQLGAVAFSPDGTLVVAGIENSLRLWEVKTGKLRRVIVRDPPGWTINCLTFSPGGTLLLAANLGSVDIYVVGDLLHE